MDIWDGELDSSDFLALAMFTHHSERALTNLWNDDINISRVYRIAMPKHKTHHIPFSSLFSLIIYTFPHVTTT
jgi:hypothetical protein